MRIIPSICSNVHSQEIKIIKKTSVFGVTDSEGYNYPAFMGMELVQGYLESARGGRFYESDIYNDELNRDVVKSFDIQFLNQIKDGSEYEWT